MAKISELPLLAAPTGLETIPVLDGDTTRRALLRDLAAAAVAPSVAVAEAAASTAMAQRQSLGEMIDRSTIALRPQAGATALPDGRSIRFDSGGSGSFIVYQVRIDDADRAVLEAHPGTALRIDAELAIDGDIARLSEPNADFLTRVIRDDTPLGDAEQLGALDTVRSGYAGSRYRRSTTVIFEPDMAELGGLVQIPIVAAGAPVTISIVSHRISIESTPASAGTAQDMTRAVQSQRAQRGEARRFDVGRPGTGFATLGLACASLSPASADARTTLLLADTIDTTKAALPLNTNLFGLDPVRSRIRYAGSLALSDATRTAHDPVLLRGNHIIQSISIYTENSNYCFHGESAGAVRDGHCIFRDVDARHGGNEGAFAAGGLSEGGRYTPPLGWGFSSGGTLEIERSTFTAYRGGGLYIHNTQRQDDPCRCLIRQSIVGGDDPYSPDITVSTLGSGTRDVLDLSGVTLTNGVIGYTAGWQRSDDYQPADHMEFSIVASATSPFITMLQDPGKALRIRSATLSPASIVEVSGAGADLLFGPGRSVRRGAAGMAGGAFGAIDVGTGVRAANGMGARIAAAGGNPMLIVSIDGGAPHQIALGPMAGAQEATIVASIAAALGTAAVVDLFHPGHDFRPVVPDRERVLRNTGTFGIHRNTAVVMNAAGTLCRCAEPGDMVGAALAPGLLLGIALQDIKPDAIGRIQVSGWVNAEQLDTAVGHPNMGDGYTIADPANAGGIHGRLVYAGNGSALLRCIRENMDNGRGRYLPATLLLA